MENVKGLLSKNKKFFGAIIVLFAFRWSFADQYRVPSESMAPSIHVGDHIFTNKLAYSLKFPFTKIHLVKTGSPRFGDVIVFEFPEDRSVNYVKRVIGIPGDSIEIRKSQIFLNGVHVENSTTAQPDQVFIVPSENYFVMGDNRNNSYDSRMWGFVPRENILGKASRVLWNVKLSQNFVPQAEFDRIGVIL